MTARRHSRNARLPTRLFFALQHLMMALVLAAGGTPAAAQFTQYVAPGTLGSPPQDLQERLERGAANAPYRLGTLRLDPLLYVRDASYQTNVFGATRDEPQVDDYRLLVAAGLNAYQPLGDKAMLSAFVTPEYSYWAESEELREFNLSAGAGVFAFFNRLTLTAEARRQEQETRLNAEVTAPIDLREERLSLGLELEIRRSLFVFAALRRSDYTHGGAAGSTVSGLELLALDREYESLRTGIRLRLGDKWLLGAGVEDSRNDFDFDPGSRSNDGSGPFAELRFDGNRISAQVAISDLELDFPAASPLAGFSSTTGTGRLAYATPQNFTFTLYGSRNIVFAARDTESLLVERRLGASLSHEPGGRLSWLAFFESGDLDFSGPATSDRVDDLTALGVNVGYELSRVVSLILVYEDSDYESSLPEFDRGISTFGLRLAFRDNLFPF